MTRGSSWKQPATASWRGRADARQGGCALRTRALVRWGPAEADRLYGNGRLALHAARQHAPDAHVYFREAGATPLTEEQHAWRVRAALRAQSWIDVRDATQSMPPAQRDETAWRYWRARALKELDAGDEARVLLAGVATEFGFYGLLAREALGVAFVPVSEPVQPSAEVMKGFGTRADVQRAVKLGQLDMRIESIREWSPVVRGLNDEGLLVAAEFARRAGWNGRQYCDSNRPPRFALRIREYSKVRAAGSDRLDSAPLRDRPGSDSFRISSLAGAAACCVVPPRARVEANLARTLQKGGIT